MIRKHQEELTKAAEKIYDPAANEIQAYIDKTYQTPTGRIKLLPKKTKEKTAWISMN